MKIFQTFIKYSILVIILLIIKYINSKYVMKYPINNKNNGLYLVNLK